jgi:anthranilate phosphoribosyltransferase
MRGETAEQIAAAARVLRRRCTPLGVEGPLLDTCGTGGDGAGTFNVSTVAAVVVAACGVRVAKHGNRAVSSRSGSADLLEALGVRIDAAPEAVARHVREIGIGFLFAPAFHGALRHAAPVRRALGLRTFWNLLGPLANPAATSHQLLGVYDPARLTTMAEVLGALGATRAWVVHGEGGLDEVSPYGATEVAELSEGRVRARRVVPEDFGLTILPAGAIGGGDAAHNAALARDVLLGTRGPYRDVVVLNAAAALCVARPETSPPYAARTATDAIDSGAARSLLARWAAESTA